MRAVAVVLCAAFFVLNAGAAFLHVHEGDATGHHHGPASHHHHSKADVAQADSAVAAPDDDSTAVPAVLAKATPTHSQQLMTATIAVSTVRASGSTYVPVATFASRAHGPPDSRPCSLRAPPRLFLL